MVLSAQQRARSCLHVAVYKCSERLQHSDAMFSFLMPKYCKPVNKKTKCLLDKGAYPFKCCHVDCDGSCVAENIYGRAVESQMRLLGKTKKPKSQHFIEMMNHLNDMPHGFRAVQEAEPYLSRMRTKNVKDLMSHFECHRFSVGKCNSCKCCKECRGKALQVKVLMKRYNFVVEFKSGAKQKISKVRLGYMARQRDKDFDIDSVTVGQVFIIEMDVIEYTNLMKLLLKEYVSERSTNYYLPHFDFLMVASDIFMSQYNEDYFRKRDSPVGSLIDAWVFEDDGITFFARGYDHEKGLWPREEESTQVPLAMVQKLRSYVLLFFSRVSFPVIVPEDSRIFKMWLESKHSLRP